MQAVIRRPRATLDLPIRRQYARDVSRPQNQWNMHWLSAGKCMPSGSDSIKCLVSHSTVVMIAKRRTAMEHNTLLQFNSAWKRLLDITDLSVSA
jgi:hypothetical protein